MFCYYYVVFVNVEVFVVSSHVAVFLSTAVKLSTNGCKCQTEMVALQVSQLLPDSTQPYMTWLPNRLSRQSSESPKTVTRLNERKQFWPSMQNCQVAKSILTLNVFCCFCLLYECMQHAEDHFLFLFDVGVLLQLAASFLFVYCHTR